LCEFLTEANLHVLMLTRCSGDDVCAVQWCKGWNDGSKQQVLPNRNWPKLELGRKVSLHGWMVMHWYCV